MKSKLLIAIYLLLISLASRLPFFFVDVINWDESTFILMGQSVLDGHLPYTELWDIKPPLAFVSYALLIALLGKSIISIRLGGVISVFLTSWLVYAIAENIWRRRAGILAATLFIVLSALIPDGQAIMTEHMALLPLMAGLAVLVLNRSTLRVLLVAGILLTIATLIRLNLAYVVVSVGLWILFSHFKPKLKTFWRVLAYCCGSFGTIFLTYIPYLVTGNGEIWLSSVILAPLGYSSSQENVWKTFQAQINFILASISPLQEINNLLPDRSIVPEFLLPARELPVELVGISLLVWLAGLGGAFIISDCSQR
ncbi:MAG: glycosyltransferase family 39 protein [Pleurocapsa sp. MO_226.B13]|nr:glycosyltransferase family 39 protein [Pleurocapsa sp. MO_226.B13]